MEILMWWLIIMTPVHTTTVPYAPVRIDAMTEVYKRWRSAEGECNVAAQIINKAGLAQAVCVLGGDAGVR